MSQPLDRAFALEAVRVTEAAAVAAAMQIGRGDEHAADQAAVEAMRAAFNQLADRRHGRDRRGRARRSADALYRREGGRRRDRCRHRARSARRHDADRQGAAQCAGRDGHGRARHAAECAGHLYGQDRDRRAAIRKARSISMPIPPKTSCALAKAKGVKPGDITACILDRPRHANIIERSARPARRCV